MKPHPRIRKTIKWGSAAATVLLVAVWVGSGWIGPSVSFPNSAPRWSVSHGCFVRTGGPVAGTGQTGLPWGEDLVAKYTIIGAPIRFRILWLPSLATAMGVTFFAVPFWPLILMSAAPSAVLWHIKCRARLREQLGRCPKCGYDRTGLASADAKCPECGSEGTSP